MASNADQIASVRFYLEEKLPELSEDKRNFFSQFYGITPCIKGLENSSSIDKDGFGLLQLIIFMGMEHGFV